MKPSATHPAPSPARLFRPSRLPSLLSWAFGLMLVLGGIDLVWNGCRLVALGGSPYYAPVGVAMLVAGLAFLRRHVLGPALTLAILVLTVPWALVEAGLNFWALTARLGVLVAFALIALLLAPSLRGAAQTHGFRRTSYSLAAGLALVMLGIAVKAFQPVWTVTPSSAAAIASDYVAKDDGQNWTGLGRTPDGQRFVPATQITTRNVKDLQVAWTFRTGDIAFGGEENQNTPLQIGATLYACTPTNQVFAIDAATGKPKWHFDPDVNAGFTAAWQRCRSLAYADLARPDAHPSVPVAADACPRRIYVATGDRRLIALDADSGQRCPGFGVHGEVDLAEGMGRTVPGFYNPTSGPVFARGNLIVGGWVMDNQSVDEPSGVVRAFDAVTGKLSWAWDIGRPGQSNPPAAGQTYTRGTPNMWSVPTVDEALGMVYLPTGNATPDLFGGHRSPVTDRHSSAVVAVDARTGVEQWVFQTTHHDVWDYDLPSKPVLYDAPDGHRGRIPALIQTTKRGEIFVLDRRTGTPIAKVVEKAVATDGVPGEHLAPTQPYSVGMPEIRDPVLTEKSMWGISPFDQLSCRLAFKRLKNEGDFTPPSVRPFLVNPSPFGTMNWGGISIDRIHDYLIVNDMRIMMQARLIPRAQVETALVRSNKALPGTNGVLPMAGTPYGAERAMVMSPLAVPCSTPPFGNMTAIDMNTRRIVWQRSMGTVEQMGPLGIRTHLPVPLGMPTLGGPVTTASGLIFFTGTADYYLRALDVATGKEVWKSPLPVGAQSTPLVFEQAGREYVVVTAGGARDTPDRGDYIIAYALPRR